MEELRRYAETHGLGSPLRLVTLDGQLSLVGGGKAPAVLCQTSRGAWLVGHVPGRDGVSRALAGNPSLRYEERLLGDRLHVDGLHFGVPMGKGAEVKLAIALGRLLAEHPELSPCPDPGRFHDEAPAIHAYWVASILDPGERLLASLDTSLKREVPSEVLPTHDTPVRFLLTDRRQLLVALNEVGDAQLRSLPTSALQVDGDSGRVQVRLGPAEWQSTRTNGADYKALEGVISASGPDRIRRIAALNWPAHPAFALELMRNLEAPTGLDQILIATIAASPDPARALDAARVAEGLGSLGEMEPTQLVDHLEPWFFPPERLREIVVIGVDALPDRASWLLPLHRLAHDQLQSAKPDAGEAARIDIALAEHLVLAGDTVEAVARLGQRLGLLPDEELADLLPPEDADLTAGSAGQAHRIRLLELLAVAQGHTGEDLLSIVALAQLQPLVPKRVNDLASASEGELAERARHAHALFDDLRPVRTWPPEINRGLSKPVLDDRLRHPAARSEGAVGWVQGWISRQPQPSRSSVKSYCEPITPKRHPVLHEALSSAARALGVPQVEGYISHGVLAHGVRAYEDEPPFLLLGGGHLYPDDPLHLDEGELRFVLGSELAHLRFQHRRATGAQVWQGTGDTIRSTLDVAASAFSLGASTHVGRVIADKRTYRLLSSVFSAQTLARIYTDGGGQTITTVSENVAKGLGGGLSAMNRADSVTAVVDRARKALAPPRLRESLGVDPRELVAAHRAMQLTADRAGLLACGDIRAAIRGIFLGDPKRHAALDEGQGLLQVLRGNDEPGLEHQDLAIRAAALIGFYLSEDYAWMRDALRQAATVEE